MQRMRTDEIRLEETDLQVRSAGRVSDALAELPLTKQSPESAWCLSVIVVDAVVAYKHESSGHKQVPRV